MVWFLRIFVLMGGLFMTAGAWLLASDGSSREAARVVALPHATPAASASLPLDTAVLVTGRLVALDTPGPRGFLAYHLEQFLRVERSGAQAGQQQWQRLRTERLQIAVEDGGVSVGVDGEYMLAAYPHSEMTDTFAESRTLTDSTQRFLGFKAGDTVTLDGRMVSGIGGVGSPRVEATTLFGGSADAYVGQAQDNIAGSKIAGAILLVIGIIFVAGGLVVMRKLRTRRGASGQS